MSKLESQGLEVLLEADKWVIRNRTLSRECPENSTIKRWWVSHPRLKSHWMATCCRRSNLQETCKTSRHLTREMNPKSKAAHSWPKLHRTRIYRESTMWWESIVNDTISSIKSDRRWTSLRMKSCTIRSSNWRRKLRTWRDLNRWSLGMPKSKLGPELTKCLKRN